MRRAMLTLVVLGVVAGAGWWFVFRTDAPFSLNREPGVTVERHPMPEQEVQRLESALNSADRQQQASAMTPELRAVYLAQSQSMLPPGGTVRIQPDTFARSGNAATVDAVFGANGSNAMFTLILLRTDANSPWLLVNTEGK